MTKNLKILIIPSAGPEWENEERFLAAKKYAEGLRKKGIEVRYLLTGVGPDINERLRQEGRPFYDFYGPFESTNGLGIEIELWNNGIQTVGERYEETGIMEPLGIDTASMNSIDNIFNTFPLGAEGDYAFFSRTGHNIRFKAMEQDLRRLGYLSNKLKIDYVNVEHPYSAKEILYDTAHLAKYLTKGRRELKERAMLSAAVA